ncbi:MAG: class I SAM-dependent methyltransferase [Methanosarcina thermophila]|jgi:SAM-dependent methyltransferase|uniref:Methyltransferase domain-containing protein n=3 Tax=Methanosarcina thermophila TaxID=2210 RepID=A0A1I7BBL4_METTE|nr:class I SAM-dependent methyltransferase [Methanosarcina thermophila]ALK06489.1 MAG: methyltransferase type 11 [Methanosarcina sp. 795]AKB11848.1 Methyltransferase type 11 [Methanosarcina thermophila TM-1]AKB14958.1 Methyltransferase type 11 [Methanosarcina thermophila CHTI-55]NLU56962.1 class I SAM-dependent methyltransferase [Methanosarcina thermophila]SFT84595.1 Methyltransferase domain-containing protein [Methanosarcina thermophila]
MKIRESGMPAENQWEDFFDPGKIQVTMGFDHGVVNAIDFECGYGTFTIPASKLINGTIYAIDIEEEMVKRVTEKAINENLINVKAMLCDFILEGSGLKDQSVDYAMLFNILRAEKPEGLLKEAYRILIPGGKFGIIHWSYDPETPRGPPIAIRLRPEQCIKWASDLGFKLDSRHDLNLYHYGLVFSKPI